MRPNGHGKTHYNWLKPQRVGGWASPYSNLRFGLALSWSAVGDAQVQELRVLTADLRHGLEHNSKPSCFDPDLHTLYICGLESNLEAQTLVDELPWPPA